jgi:superfamily II DNA or RNA helicase
VKKLELDEKTWKKKTTRTTRREYEIGEPVGSLKVVHTHQGYWAEAVAFVAARGIPYELVDLRPEDNLPLPKLGLMKNLRFSQRSLLETGLLKRCSGIFDWPTRYGKSSGMRAIIQAFPEVDTLYIVPGVDLLGQTVEELKKAFPDKDIKQIGGGSRVRYQSRELTVCSADSLHKLDPGPPRLILSDEPHSMMSDSREESLLRFDNARKYGFTATPEGRFDGKDRLLTGIFGPVISRIAYKEAVAETAVEQITVMMIEWPLDPNPGMDRDRAYRDLFFQHELILRCARYLCNEVLPPHWQTLFFIKSEKQAELLQERMGEVSIAMAKRLSKTERAALTSRVRDNHISRVICSDIYVQGVTFHDLMCLVNLGGGGSSTTTIQKPGRLAEIRHGKSGALMIDFRFVNRQTAAGFQAGVDIGEGVACMVRDSAARMAAYEKIGYNVITVPRNRILETFQTLGIRAPEKPEGF